MSSLYSTFAQLFVASVGCLLYILLLVHLHVQDIYVQFLPTNAALLQDINSAIRGESWVKIQKPVYNSIHPCCFARNYEMFRSSRGH